MENVQLRPCNPEDVDEAVRLIYSSGPEAFSYVFNTKKSDAMGFLAHAFVTPGGEFSFDNHFAITDNNVLVGVGSIYNSNRAGNFMWHEIKKISSNYGLSAPSVMLRGLKMERVLKLPVKNEVYIGHLGVLPEFRSRGYGRKLIELMIDLFSAPDVSFVLDVATSNPRAQSLYSKIGFSVIKNIPCHLRREGIQVPDFNRMELKSSR